MTQILDEFGALCCYDGMSETPNYKPGDVVNGHVLTSDMRWVPVGAQETSQPQSKDWSRKGIVVSVLIVVFLGLVGYGLVRANQDANDANCEIVRENPWMNQDGC